MNSIKEMISVKNQKANIIFNIIAGILAPIVAFLSAFMLAGFFSAPSPKELFQGRMLAVSSLIILLIGERLIYKYRNKKLVGLKHFVLVSIISFLVGVFLTWMVAFFAMM